MKLHDLTYKFYRQFTIFIDIHKKGFFFLANIEEMAYVKYKRSSMLILNKLMTPIVAYVSLRQVKNIFNWTSFCFKWRNFTHQIFYQHLSFIKIHSHSKLLSVKSTFYHCDFWSIFLKVRCCEVIKIRNLI